MSNSNLEQDDGFEMEPSQMTPNQSDNNITPPSVHGNSGQYQRQPQQIAQPFHQKNQLSEAEALKAAHQENQLNVNYYEGSTNAALSRTTEYQQMASGRASHPATLQSQQNMQGGMLQRRPESGDAQSEALW